MDRYEIRTLIDAHAGLASLWDIEVWSAVLFCHDDYNFEYEYGTWMGRILNKNNHSHRSHLFGPRVGPRARGWYRGVDSAGLTRGRGGSTAVLYFWLQW